MNTAKQLAALPTDYHLRKHMITAEAVLSPIRADLYKSKSAYQKRLQDNLAAVLRGYADDETLEIDKRLAELQQESAAHKFVLHPHKNLFRNYRLVVVLNIILRHNAVVLDTLFGKIRSQCRCRRM